MIDYLSMNTEELLNIFPFLQQHSIWTGEALNSKYTFADDLPPGWRKLFFIMCEELKEVLIENQLLNDFYFIQIKEKYGIMRCYPNHRIEAIDKILNDYAHISQYVCCMCGALATQTAFNWICPYCDQCLPSNEQATPINQINLIRHVEQYHIDENDKLITEYIDYDCSTIWDKYLNQI